MSHTVTTKTFGAYARYYDLLYAEKNYAAEAYYVHQLIQKYRPGACSLMDVGCGTGAHGAELARMGYRILGVDSSPDMLILANDRAEKLPSNMLGHLKVVQGDARSFRTPAQFEVVTSLFHVMSYQTTNEDVAAAIHTAAAHLELGGLFIFDFWYGPAVLADPPAVRVRRLENEHTSVLRIAEPLLDVNSNTVVVRYEIHVEERDGTGRELIHENHCMRYFFLPEMRWMLQAAGFEWLDAMEWMTTERPSQHIWNALICCRRTGRVHVNT